MNLRNFVIAGLLALQISTVNAKSESSPSTDAPTPPPAESPADMKARKDLKLKLVDLLTQGPIANGKFDKEAEINIANVEMQLVEAYLKQGDRRNAIVYAVLARRTLQNVYDNPRDPKLAPVYNLLSRVYETAYDKDEPTANKANLAQSKLYKDMLTK